MSSPPVALVAIIQIFFVLTESTYVEHEHGEFTKPLWNSTYTDQLKRDLLTSYDKFARPTQHTNITTVIMDIDLKHVHLDDAKFLLTVNAWLKMKWRDDKLQWNASDYGGLKHLHLADHEIWQPDIALYNR
ncbi:unnamed protein product [Nezara viridula]|uniref:Neurotransmitter-gated ion-channel ligand-binding domain-containing protein n=1 Tax=Nezara viridula TaxID=85310 RepID=A0A9P0HPV3_NEZVI|nr:unnamed protein product [Nezara viridula]